MEILGRHAEDRRQYCKSQEASGGGEAAQTVKEIEAGESRA
jgi:hypothetical protein